MDSPSTTVSSRSSGDPGWFFDPVHVDSVGSRSRVERVVAALVG